MALNDDGSVASRIDRVDRNRDDVRFNDATSDAEGRIWACTLGGTPEEPLGTYYCYGSDLSRRTVDDGYLVANGPALSPDRRLLYTVETAGHPGRPQGVYVSRLTDGTLEAQRRLIDWRAYDSAPDGVVTDADGNLWLGEFRGNVLRCFSPEGEQLASVPLPAWSVTKAVFGGERGDSPLRHECAHRGGRGDARPLPGHGRRVRGLGNGRACGGTERGRVGPRSMKITSLEPLVVDIGPRNWLFVVVETDEGVSGVGEEACRAIRARSRRRSRSIASTSSARTRRGSSTSGS